MKTRAAWQTWPAATSCQGRGCEPGLEPKPHQLVVGWMERNLVNPVAVPVKGLQHRRKAVGQRAGFASCRAARILAKTRQGIAMAPATGAHHRSLERVVSLKEIDIFEWRRLVDHGMRVKSGNRLHGCHGALTSLPAMLRPRRCGGQRPN